MPAKHDAAWWRDHRARKKANLAQAEGPHFMLDSDGKPVQSAPLPPAAFLPGAGPAPQGHPVPAVRLPASGKSGLWDPPVPPVELSSDFVREPNPHLACDLLEASLRVEIADLKDQLAHVGRQSDWDDPVADLDEVFR